MKFKLEFTAEQMGVLNAALHEMPYRMAAPFIADINEQIQAQSKSETLPVTALVGGDPYPEVQLA